ncbi:MAG: cupin domain-containing protein [Quadrisphaera sp.]
MRALTGPTRRLLCADALSADLPEPLPAGEAVIAGAPTARYLELAGPEGVEVGLWEMTPGSARDTEAEEVFVVLAGRATVTVAVDGDDDEVLELAAGSVVHLHAGDRTTWAVHERLRKLYLQLP